MDSCTVTLITIGLIIVAGLLLVWHIQKCHPWMRIINALSKNAYWHVYGTPVVLEMKNVTPTSMVYDIYESWEKTYTARARITYVTDGITTCTGYYIRMIDDYLEIQTDRVSPFRPLVPV